MVWVVAKILLHLFTSFASQFKCLLLTVFTNGESLDYLFTLLVNGLMVYISLKVAPGLDMTFTHSILAGIIMSLVNYIVSSVVEVREQDRDNKVRS